LKKEEYIFHHKNEVEETATVASIESNEIDSILLTTLRPSSTGDAIDAAVPTAEIDIFSTLVSNGDDQAEIIKDYEKTVTTTMVANNTEDDLISNEVHLPKMFNSPEREVFGEDFDVEEDTSEEEYDDYERKEKENERINQNHKSRQHTMPSSTLLHGFIANPGYPSYYIGNDKDKECKWKIRMSKGQRMTLTIFDMHLRSELKSF
jgi:hypothetical protein